MSRLKPRPTKRIKIKTACPETGGLKLTTRQSQPYWADAQGVHVKSDRTHMDIEDLQRRQDELQKRIELVRSYL